MYDSNKTITQKIKTEVELALTDGSVMSGEIFLRSDQRVLDIVNDDRKFLPFACFDGPVSVVNKDMIARITPVERSVQSEAKVVAFGQ